MTPIAARLSTLLLAAFAASPALATSESLIYSFNGVDGALPSAALLYAGGDLYGTSAGTLYKLTLKGAETTLATSIVSFSPLIKIGSTLYGINNFGNGSIYASTLSGAMTTLHSFSSSGGDGLDPCCGLLAAGHTLYGTTEKGGANGTGSVFSVTTAGSETVLYSFGPASGTDGTQPLANLVSIKGIFYGTTAQGGAYGNGTIFSLTPGGTEKVLYSFGAPGSTDGGFPNGLVAVQGKLYGTTIGGGTDKIGTLYSFTPASGKEKVLHSFKGAPTDGAQPNSGLIYSGGLLYGTTQQGGAGAGCATPGTTCGTVWQSTLTGTETVLHSFTGPKADGGFPETGVIDIKGVLYGTTAYGGTANVGTVFEVKP